MVFSAFSVGQRMTQFTGNMPGSRIPNRPTSGGSFTPTSTESFFMLRSHLDNEFESAFINQYKAMMQNRLNTLVEDLRAAYSNLLNTSMGQQIGDGVVESVRSDTILDGDDAAPTLRQGDDGFKDFGTTTVSGAGGEGLINDGIAGYSRTIGGLAKPTEFRTIQELTRAAGDISGEVVITMRSEENPPKIDDLPAGLGGLATALGSMFGGPPDPTLFNQQLKEQKTTYNTGGFWSTINYLNNFAPRELQYSYAVGYTVNSDEAGDREYLINGKLVHAADLNHGAATANPSALGQGERVKWDSMDPADGYKTEVSGTSASYGTVTNRQNAFIIPGSDLWYAAASTGNAGASASIVDTVSLASGSRIYQASDLATAGLTGSNVEVGSKFTTEVAQDGSDADLATIGAAGGAKVTSSLFFNHYELETRTVKYNTSDAGNEGIVKVTSGMDRSHAIDASKFYQWVDVNNDGILDKSTDDDSDGIPDELSITGGSAKIAKVFNGKFIQSVHQIKSVNNQNIVGFGTEYDLNAGEPIIGNFEIAKYEGIQRSKNMSQGFVQYEPPAAFEINATDGVPTDWYQAELLSTDTTLATVQTAGAWFPFVSGTAFDNGAGTGYSGQTVQLRNTFELTKDEFLQLDTPASAWPTDMDGVPHPTYTRKTYNLDITLDNNLTGGILYVNGKPTNPPDPTEGIVLASGLNNNIDIGPYLQEGENTIAIQTTDDGTAGNTQGVSIVADLGNSPDVNTVINSRIITGYNSVGEMRFEPNMSRPGMSRMPSRWQARAVPTSTTTNMLKLASDPLYTGTSYKAANSFAELLMEFLNKPKYRDIFTLGLVSNLNKLIIQGSANVPSGASIQAAVSVYFDPQKRHLVVNQDKLIAKGGS